MALVPRISGYMPPWLSVVCIVILFGSIGYFFWIGKPQTSQPLTSITETAPATGQPPNTGTGNVLNNTNTSYNSLGNTETGTVVNKPNTSYNSPMNDKEGMLVCSATKDQDKVT